MRNQAITMAILFVFLTTMAAPAPPLDPTPPPRRDETMDEMLRAIVARKCRRLSSHEPDRVRAAIIDLGTEDEPASPPAIGSWLGQEPIYPASVVKLYYMGAVFAWRDAGLLNIDGNLHSNLRYMIGPSSNVATQRIFYRLTGVNGSAVETMGQLKARERKRESINEWLRGLGLTHTDAGFPTWDEEPARGDLQLMTGNLDGSGPKLRHNSTTAEDVALFLSRIARDDLVSPEACEKMRALMKRDTRRSSRGGLRRIFQDGLPSHAALYSKSGYTSHSSHDAGIVIGPRKHRFVLVVMSETRWDRSSFLADCASEILTQMQRR